MNRKEAAELLPIIQAYAEGKEIEIFDKTKKWETAILPHFDCDPSFYRIKPESKYRPFKDAEECWTEMQKHQPFGWVFSKKTGVKYLIRYIDNTVLFTSIQYSFNSAFDNLAFTDLVPFGVKVEE
uniref:hypothetical protein n=1 Tax=Segatella hominis TaxID=2518605 RepID=UPI00402832EB